MDKPDNQGKEREDRELEAPGYLDRPTIYAGPRTIQKPPTRLMVWLRSIMERQQE
mgnify:FL=1